MFGRGKIWLRIRSLNKNNNFKISMIITVSSMIYNFFFTNYYMIASHQNVLVPSKILLRTSSINLNTVILFINFLLSF